MCSYSDATRSAVPGDSAPTSLSADIRRPTTSPRVTPAGTVREQHVAPLLEAVLREQRPHDGRERRRRRGWTRPRRSVPSPPSAARARSRRRAAPRAGARSRGPSPSAPSARRRSRRPRRGCRRYSVVARRRPLPAPCADQLVERRLERADRRTARVDRADLPPRARSTRAARRSRASACRRGPELGRGEQRGHRHPDDPGPTTAISRRKVELSGASSSATARSRSILRASSEESISV